MKTATMNVAPQARRSALMAGAAAALAIAAMGFAGAADARDDVSFSVGIGVPGVNVGVTNAYPVYSQPIYLEQQPIYVQPRSVYVQPAPIYYRQPPVYVQPAPVYYGPPTAYYRPAPVYYAPPVVYRPRVAYGPYFAPRYAPYQPVYGHGRYEWRDHRGHH